MFTVLIAEDEPLIRKGIIYCTDWAKLDCAIPLEASNGEEAAEMIRQHRPDIVLLDVNMPLMDGLTMLAEASTRDISKASKPVGFDESVKVAKRGGNVANVARQQLEAETGQPVITAQNAAPLNAVVTEMIESSAQVLDRLDELKTK